MEIFQRDDLAKGQREAELGVRQFRASSPDWAAKFELLQAEIMVRRGVFEDALGLLADYHPDSYHAEENIRKLAIEADALTREQRLPEAEQRISPAENLCTNANYASCGYLLRTRGLLAVRQGKALAARQFFLDSLLFARAHQDRWAEVGALNNLGFAAIQIGRFDEAVDWLRPAYQCAARLGSTYWSQLILGNLGSAYYQLGDDDRALELFLEAEKSAASLGNLRYELKWINNAGAVYHDTGDSTRAAQSYKQALKLATQIGSKEDVASALEDLARV